MEGLVDEWFRVKCILVRYRRFEVTYDMDNRTVFVKYANCRKFFRAGGKTLRCIVIIYLCRIRAKFAGRYEQATRANKEKNDIVTKEYYKAYMEYKIITTCHPKDREGKKTFIRLIEKLKTCRRKLAADMVTVDDCREIFVIFELKNNNLNY